MTLLETIRALDAPYVVWLPPEDFFDVSGDAMQMAAGVFVSTYYGHAVRLRVKAAGPHLVDMPTPAEIDTMLAGLP